MKDSSLTSYIISTVFLPLPFPSNGLLGASDQSDTGGSRQWHITGIPLTDFYPVTLSADASWIVQGSSNSLSLISVFPGGQLLMKNIHNLYLSRELHQQEHMYSCNKARKYHAKPCCFKYVCEIQQDKFCIDLYLSYTTDFSRSTLAVSR